jgi:hypothetical protein
MTPDLPRKPLYTKPCNHCGLCCLSQLCPVGEEAFPGVSAPCPALVTTSGKAVCGLVVAETLGKLEPLIAKGLGIGCGCSMPDSYTTDDQIEAFDKRAREMVRSDQFTVALIH